MNTIEKREIDPAAQPEALKETAATSPVDCKWTFGQIGTEICMKKAASEARENGIAVSGLIRANHIGRVGEFAEMAHGAGMAESAARSRSTQKAEARFWPWSWHAGTCPEFVQRRTSRNPRYHGGFQGGRGGTRTLDLTDVNRAL